MYHKQGIDSHAVSTILKTFEFKKGINKTCSRTYGTILFIKIWNHKFISNKAMQNTTKLKVTWDLKLHDKLPKNIVC